MNMMIMKMNMMVIMMKNMTGDSTGSYYNRLLRNIEIYTERQKKHHFFRTTLIKIQSINMNHNWALISYSTPSQAHLQKPMFDFLLSTKKKVKAGEIARGHKKK